MQWIGGTPSKRKGSQKQKEGSLRGKENKSPRDGPRTKIVPVSMSKIFGPLPFSPAPKGGGGLSAIRVLRVQ
jgi:hypothetical protein